MRRALLAKAEFDAQVIELWGQKIKASGKNDGQTQADCLDAVADEHPEWFEADGWCDPDLLVGNLREEGIKILDINEQVKRNQIKKEDGYEDAT
jgi:hypothetical protein